MNDEKRTEGSDYENWHGNSSAVKKRQSNGLTLKEKGRSLLSLRRQLPIWAHRDEICRGLRKRDVMLLVGETGSGKSTQVPQFLINEPWCRSLTIKPPTTASKQIAVGGRIAITEPRRVAAITLARRVAEEIGTPLGASSPASQVGYSVRFDNSTSPNTRIKFLTEGMLLQEMMHDPWLRQYSAVVVDEVHERGMNVDLIMGFLRNIVCGEKEGRAGIPLKVVVMSATADLEGLLNFFDDGFSKKSLAPKVDITNSSLCIQSPPDEDAAEYGVEWSGISSSDESDDGPTINEGIEKNKNSASVKMAINSTPQTGIHKSEPHKNAKLMNKLMNSGRPNETPQQDVNGEATTLKSATHDLVHISICYIEGRQFPVKINYSPEPVLDFVDAALQAILRIHYKEPLPGDILVFLTGQETVESLETLANEYALALGPEAPKALVLPLFAALPQVAQQRVFQPTPPKTRKIILSTNIAETSVTVSGVRFVIDCGKSKVKQFRARLGLDSLLVKPISKSAAIQRKGRAGREAPGQCYRLYTEQDYLALTEVNIPEILRCDISQAILTMKARGVDNILDFPFLDRPPREALEKALLQLFQLGALDESGDVNEIGLRMAKLPLSAPLGRVLLAAADAELDCLSEVVDIISCLSVENVFLNLSSEEAKEQAEAPRRALFQRDGDHLTLLATVRSYAAEDIDRKTWAERHFISHRAMQAVMVSLWYYCRQIVIDVLRMFESSFEFNASI